MKIQRSNLKKINVWYALYSFLFSVMLMCTRHIFQFGSTVETTYVTDFKLIDLIYLLFLTPAVYLLIQLIIYMLKAVSQVFVKEPRKNNYFLFVMCAILFVVLWIPYMMSFWPGGIYSDTVDSLNMALGNKEWDNHNPILYTLLWKIVFQCTGAFSDKGVYPGLKFFTVAQTVLIALVMAGFIAWNYKKGFHKMFVALLFFYVALNSLYPFYGISLWKDTLFSVVVFLYSFFLYQLMDKNTEDCSFGCLTVYIVLSLLVIFLRNNGIYIFVFTAIVAVVINLKKKKLLVKLGSASALIGIFALIIQGPVYDAKGFNIDTARESLGIPLQQVAYIVCTDGEVEEGDMQVLEEIMPIENWYALYDPIVVDTIKFDPSFNNGYLEEHSADFVRVYLNMIKNNPVKAVKAYLLATIGFWNIKEGSSVAYICNFHFGNAEYFMSDYFDYYFDFSFQDMVEPRHYLSAAVPVWLMLFTLICCLAQKKYRELLAVIPTCGVWVTIMLATPIAYSFRYIYSLFLCIPLYCLIIIQTLGSKKPLENETGLKGMFDN